MEKAVEEAKAKLPSKDEFYTGLKRKVGNAKAKWDGVRPLPDSPGARSQHPPPDDRLTHVNFTFHAEGWLPDDAPCSVSDLGNRMSIAMAKEPGAIAIKWVADREWEC